MKENAASAADSRHYEAILEAVAEAIGQAGMGLCVIDPAGRIECMNDVARARFGNEIQTSCCEPPANQDEVRNDRRRERILSADNAERLLMTLQDGGLAEAAGAPLKLPGGGLSKLLILRDVSEAPHAPEKLRLAMDRLESRVEERTAALRRKMQELKYAERELRNKQAVIQALLDNSTSIIAARDAEGRYLLANPAWERIAGISAAAALGRAIETIHPPDIARRMRGLDQEVMEQGRSIEREEEILVAGQARTFIATRFPIHDPQGRIQAVCLIATDITERKRNEIEIDRARQLAEAADRAKSEFLANMSHELRTPLNAVIGFSEMIQKRILGPLSDGRYEDYVDHILMSGRHLLDLINDVLDLSKVETGRLNLEESAVDPARVCAEALDMIAEQAKHQKITLKRRISPNAPHILIDGRRLRQIVLNLLSNAVKFTAPGGRAELKLNWDSQGLVITVEDSGIGIAAADIPRVLQPFGRLESAMHRQYEGAGLGLPLAKKLVEAQHGTLSITSAPGAGTCVTVHFPAARFMDQAAGRAALPAPPQNAA